MRVRYAHGDTIMLTDAEFAEHKDRVTVTGVEDEPNPITQRLKEAATTPDPTPTPPDTRDGAWDFIATHPWKEVIDLIKNGDVDDVREILRVEMEGPNRRRVVKAATARINELTV